MPSNVHSLVSWEAYSEQRTREGKTRMWWADNLLRRGKRTQIIGKPFSSSLPARRVFSVQVPGQSGCFSHWDSQFPEYATVQGMDWSTTTEA